MGNSKNNRKKLLFQTSVSVSPNRTEQEQEVYRGYIVFEFSVKMFVCVCVCKLFFLSKISLELLDIG